MKYRVIVDDDHVENEPIKRIRATRQEFPRIELAQEYAHTCAQSRNPQVVPAGSEYEETASDILARFGIEFRAVLVGDDCPMFCEDAAKDKDMDLVNTFPRKSHIHGKHYRCTFSAKGRGHLAIDFWNSYADEEQNALGTKQYRDGKSIFKHGGKGPQTPKPYDVIACIQKSEVGTFEDFCSEFGYDSDSRRAEETYNAVVKEWRKTEKFFTSAELAELQEVQ